MGNANFVDIKLRESVNRKMREINKFWIGIDVGSVTVKIIYLFPDNKISNKKYVRHHGEPIFLIFNLLEEIPVKEIQGISVTGSGGRFLSELLNITYINEIVAQAKANSFLYPYIRTVIEVGGEDAKLINLKDGRGGFIEDFATNTICAAGTGSFLDQQASRLGIDISDFGKFALKSKNPPRIAGRCTVFAKTDMIHLQQRATPTHDIVAGLCNALAMSFKSTICKGKKFLKPIAFEGGVAANQGMVRAFEDIIGLERGELIIPEHFACLGAIGAAIVGKSIGNKRDSFDFMKLQEQYTSMMNKEKSSSRLSPLKLKTKKFVEEKVHSIISHHQFQDTHPSYLTSNGIHPHHKLIDAYLGVDVGSLSTDLVLIDDNNNVLAKRYLPTAGKPIKAVCRGLEEIEKEIGDKVRIKGVSTTGSGRYLIGAFIGADIVKNEITSQARAAIDINKNVDPIFEIGGQDSKYISIKDGIVVDFEMNKVCAAGTGSFLEEQAERLNVKIEEEFGNSALNAPSPVSLGERCTVFIASDLVHHQSRGAKTEDLIGGLCYSIVHNYLNRVVVKKKIGNNIFFQGGVAFNKGVVAAFENILEQKITVPPHPEMTGAIGCAKIVKELKPGKTKFKGFSLWKRTYKVSSFECKDCPNHCQINKVELENNIPLFFGSRCEKYDIEKKKPLRDIPDLFLEREKILLDTYSIDDNNKSPANLKIGIPGTLPFFFDFYPFWKAFFCELGLEVIISSSTNKKIIQQGTENIVGETCFPIKVAHGHILDLIEKKVDYIFLPSIVEVGSDEKNTGLCCPYVQTIPYLAQCSIDFQNTKIIKPMVYLSRGKKYLDKILMNIGKELNINHKRIKKAIETAHHTQVKFIQTIQKRGAELLSSLNEKAIVIVSRSYNGYDQGINFDIPLKLKNLSILAIPIDYLPLDNVNISEDWPNMYWGYGQKILKGARIIKENKNLYALYLTNFGCGPDSFIASYFSKEMKGKPYLEIQVDEHSADVGIITRCEAFLDSLKKNREKNLTEKKISKPIRKTDDFRNRTVFIPYMSEHAYSLAAAFKAKGIESKVIPPSDEETLYWGRKYTLGRECYPCIITTGDMIKVIKNKEFDRTTSAFFMPSGCGPCRFGQYNVFQKMVLNELGFDDIPIYCPNQNEKFYDELARTSRKNFSRLAWRGIVAVDVMEKMLRKIRPYEINKGESERIFKDYLEKLYSAITKEENINSIIKEAKKSFEKIEIDENKKLPVIGIVGEIFIRNHSFSNNNLIKTLEELGAEVKLPPSSEWLLYQSFLTKRNTWKKKEYLNYVKNFIRDAIQRFDCHKSEKILKGFLLDYHEPETSKILKYSSPYLSPMFEGEAILSVGKAIDFYLKGVSGIVAVMPFTCMPGTIASSILNRVKNDYGDVPLLNIVYDGMEETNIRTRLEAFTYQAEQHRKQSASIQDKEEN